MRTRVLFFVGLVLLALALGRVVTPTPLPTTLAAPLSQGESYTVQKGDSLWLIAEKYLGNGAAYPAIVDATNKKATEDATFATIVDPSVIQPGWKIYIPSAEEAEALIAAPSYTPTPTLIRPIATPTPEPTEEPTPEPTEEPTPEPTEEPTLISTGRLEITHPLEMIVEEDDVVTVEIMADPRFAEIGVHPPHATGVISIETSGGRVRIEDRIRLYPVMSAELIAGNFDVIQGDADPRRGISTTYHAVWTWSIVARKSGRQQKITINIFGEATIDGEKRPVLEMSQTRNINVVEKPWPKRILDGLVNNFVAILGTGGPLALLITYLKYRADRANRQLEDKIASLENKLKELGGEEVTEGDGKTDI